MRCIRNVFSRRALIIWVLVILLISLQVVFYSQVPHRLTYIMYVEIEDSDHNLTLVDIFETFRDEKEWKTEYTHTINGREDERVDITKRGNHRTSVSFKIDAAGTLIVDGSNRVSFRTKGPPLHPRVGDVPVEDPLLINETRSLSNGVFGTLDLAVSEEDVVIRYLDFASIFEMVGFHLFLLSWFLIFLIVVATSVTPKNPFVQPAEGGFANVLFAVIGYTGLLVFFGFIVLTILNIYHPDRPWIYGEATSFAVLGLGLISIGLFFNYIFHAHKTNKD